MTYWVVFGLEIGLLIGLTLYLYSIFASFKKQPWYISCTVLLGWFLSFSLIYLIPIDITSTQHDDCTDVKDNDCTKLLVYLPEDVLLALWRVIYWTNFFLIWLVYPVMGSYALSGEFSFVLRLKAAIKENLLFYFIGSVIALLLFLYVSIVEGFAMSSVTATALAVGNTTGLFAFICLLGFGVVDIPRKLWRNSDLRMKLRFSQFQLVVYRRNLEDSKLELTKVLKLVKRVEESVREGDRFRPYVDQILEKCPTDIPASSDTQDLHGDIEIEHHRLVSLHSHLIQATHDFTRNSCLYDNLLLSSFELEDIINSFSNPDHVVKWSFREPRSYRLSNIMNKLEWYWLVWIQGRIYQFLCIICCILSLAVVWSESTFFFEGVDLSIFSLIVNSEEIKNSLWLQIVVTISVLYLTVCAYWSLFRLKIFNFYRLIPHQMTDANSLIFSAGSLGRLTAPLAYNFLFLIGFDGTAFDTLMGDIKMIPFFGADFNVYFPVILLFIASFSLFNVFSKVLAWFDIRRFQYDEDFDDDQIEEGRELLKRERDLEKRKRGTFERRPFESLKLNLEKGPVSSIPSSSSLPPVSQLIGSDEMEEIEEFDTERGSSFVMRIFNREPNNRKEPKKTFTYNKL